MFDYPMVFDVESGLPSSSEQPDTMMAGCSCLQLSTDNSLVVAGSSDGSVRVVRMDNNKYIYRMQHKSSVRSATFTGDSKMLLTAGFKKILVWSMSNGSLLYSLSRHQNFIYQLRFACNDRYLISCSEDKELVLWDVKQGSSLAHFSAHCPIKYVSVADDLSSVLFAPENIDYIGVLKPNEMLKKVINGETLNEVSEPVQKAQAFALTFSNQKIAHKSSQACIIL
jgi:WD40 repeat protein